MEWSWDVYVLYTCASSSTSLWEMLYQMDTESHELCTKIQLTTSIKEYRWTVSDTCKSNILIDSSYTRRQNNTDEIHTWCVWWFWCIEKIKIQETSAISQSNSPLCVLDTAYFKTICRVSHKKRIQVRALDTGKPDQVSNPSHLVWYSVWKQK